MAPAVALALSYLSGSIPFAAIAGKLRGVDLRKHGSGNLGATNVFRVLGWKIGLAVFLADAVKGALPVLLSPAAHRQRARSRRVGDRLRHRGHRRSRAADLPRVAEGREGRRDRGGCLLRARARSRWSSPSPCSSASCSRAGYVSLGSLISAVVLPVLLLVTLGPRSPLFVVSAVIALFVFWTHRANIGRLRRGEEHRFGRSGETCLTPSVRSCQTRASIGAGAWGTALADLLARNGHDVTIWAFEPDVAAVDQRASTRTRASSPASSLAHAVRATNDLATRVDGASLVCVATPSHLLRGILRAGARRTSRARRTLCVASKGIERDTLALMSDVVDGGSAGSSRRRAVRAELRRRSGGASADGDRRGVRRRRGARAVQEALSNAHFRVYTHDDIIGVELGGALKNVMAVATGIVEGVGLGYNSRAALITRGLAEMTRLGVALGAQPATFAGLAGLGDLVLTCTGSLSRNRAVGVEIGRGATLDEALAGKETVAEGVTTTRSALRARRARGSRDADRRNGASHSVRWPSGAARRRRAHGARAARGAGRMSASRTRPGVLQHRRGLRAHRPQAARAALLGESVPLPQSGEEPLGQSRLPAARDRADPAREAPAVHREVHHRGRASESGRASQGRRAAQRVARSALTVQTLEALEHELKELVRLLAPDEPT